ncbi:MAG: hypothetical protein IJW44_01245 [Clostridia bacterium]|nr:hypothetical protein [Clostridia bacterium]
MGEPNTIKGRFAALCEEEHQRLAPEGGGIGTYREKSLHRILKRLVCDREECWEISVGTYVADVVQGTELTEIQTGSLRPLLPKLRYYLEETEYSVTVLHPIIAEKMIYRMDRQTGELLRKRKSGAHGRIADVLPELCWISQLLPSPRLKIRVVLIGCEEYRYSERIRYRKEGAYEGEVFPREYLGEQSFSTPAEYRGFLPEADSFTAAEYGAWIKMRPRQANRALRALCALKLLDRELVGRKYVYRKI